MTQPEPDCRAKPGHTDGASGPIDTLTQRANELFEQDRERTFRKTDRLFVCLMLVQWVAAIAFALILSPHRWSGQSNELYIHIWAAIFVGGGVTLFPIFMTYAFPGAAVTRNVIAIAQMLMSTLLINLTGGRIETHFHVFASLVILSFYRDWRILIPATLVVGLDYLLRGIYWPSSVHGLLAASPWRSVEHATWVVFAGVFLVIWCRHSLRRMWAIANRTAALESEQNFRRIFQEAPIGMAEMALDGKFLQVNLALCQMLGYSATELTNLRSQEITPPEDTELARQKAKRLLQDGTQCYALEARYIRKNGELLWVNRTTYTFHEYNGRPHHQVVMVEDISERKRSEKESQQGRLQLELIMNNSHDVICTIDENGRFLTVNAASESLWGYKPEELVGRPYIDLVHPDDRPKTTQTDADIRGTKTITDVVNRYVRKDGSVVAVVWSANWSEADRMLFCVAHDITARTKMENALRLAKEEADRANRAKNEFLSRMSHELRTPLNAVLGFGQLLEQQDPTDEQRPRIKHILDAGRHLLKLTNEVLDISQIETGKLELSLEPVLIREVADEALELVRPLAAERKINISRSPLTTGALSGQFERADATPTDSNATLCVLAEQERFAQVLLNLLTNAVKYTPAGGAISISWEIRGDKHVRVEVRDTGPGIPKEKLSRLFVPFDRLGAEHTEVKGRGLGLALCQRLITAMHGSIGVESEPGRGSTFWVELERGMAGAKNERAGRAPIRTASGQRQKTEAPSYRR
jgi:two-component system sensor histidine kinase/response regulator